jgi:tetratricopeptide (TPR) repeat protein
VRTVRNLAVMLLCVLAARLPAQTQTQKWTPPRCELKPGDFRVNGGIQYLRAATEARFDDQRAKDLQDAQRVLTEAVTTGKQDKNPAAWYYLGRYYILKTDALGMDSAFTKAEALKPDCKADIEIWRRYLWAPIFNAGIAAIQANNNDSAIASFRRATYLLPADPRGPKYLAIVLYNSGQQDSALVYFRRSADVAAKDSNFAEDRKDALFNLGRIQQSLQRLPEAQATYTEYLALYPNDPEVLGALGTLHMQRGNKDSAFAIYRQIIEKADSMGWVSLLRVGVEIYQGVPQEPDTSTAGSTCRTQARSVRPALTLARIKARCDSVTTAMYRGHIQGSKEAYRLAAQALDASLTLNPHYRETLLYRVNIAEILEDSAAALPFAHRLIAIDPMSRQSIRMVAYAHQLTGKVDSTIHYLRIADSTLLADVTISEFESTDQGREMKGLITNPRQKPNAPFKLVFDFVNTKGEPLASDTVQVAAIQAGQSQAFELKPKGPSIAAWRYRKE